MLEIGVIQSLSEEINMLYDVIYQFDTWACTPDHKLFIKKLCQHHQIGIIDFIQINEISKRYYSVNPLQQPNKNTRYKVMNVLNWNYILPSWAINEKQLLTL